MENLNPFLVFDIFTCLAYSAVALMVWWVAEECVEAPGSKLMVRRFGMLHPGAGLAPGNLIAVPLPLAPPEFALKGAARA